MRTTWVWYTQMLPKEIANFYKKLDWGGATYTHKLTWQYTQHFKRLVSETEYMT